jgi:hypothetical protein
MAVEAQDVVTALRERLPVTVAARWMVKHQAEHRRPGVPVPSVPCAHALSVCQPCILLPSFSALPVRTFFTIYSSYSSRKVPRRWRRGRAGSLAAGGGSLARCL